MVGLLRYVFHIQSPHLVSYHLILVLSVGYILSLFLTQNPDFHHLQAELQSSPSSDPMILVVHFHHANRYTFRTHDLFTIVVCIHP